MKLVIYQTVILACSILLLTACNKETSDNPYNKPDEPVVYLTPESQILSGEYNTNIYLTKDGGPWTVHGKAYFIDGAILKIEAGTTILARQGDYYSETGFIMIDNNSKILAEGTEAEPILFTSEEAYNGGDDESCQWGGLTLIGKAGNEQIRGFTGDTDYNTCFGYADYNGNTCAVDLNHSSGVLSHVEIRNAGKSRELSAGELYNLYLIGVGSGTNIDNIKIVNSCDDSLAIVGGGVNLSNVSLSNSDWDYLDIDDGYIGTISNLIITAETGDAAIEISGTSTPTIDGFTITQNASDKEGGIYFKNNNVSAILKNGTIYDNVDDGYGAIHSQSTDRASDTVNINKTIFKNITLDGNSSDARFTGTSAKALQEKFHNGSGNSLN